MTEPAVATDPAKGPYTSIETRTIRIAEPVELSFTTQQDASHPPSGPQQPYQAVQPPPVGKDPYMCIERKTFKIAGPIELTLTTTVNSSHVPPPRAAQDDGNVNSLMDLLQPLAQMIIARLDEIRRAQREPQEPS
jgi:hypothetical protein